MSEQLSIPDRLLTYEIVRLAIEYIEAKGDRAIVSRDGGRVPVPVGIYELLEVFAGVYGAPFRLTPEVEAVLMVIELLWASPEVRQPPLGLVEFAWRGASAVS